MGEAELSLVMRAREAVLPGGLRVRRAMPQARRRMVGPFVFVDQMGPAELPPGHEVTVLPHPHIGLATITYLFEGEGLHRDSLGTVQRILPGEVNWMTAGAGIVHSERMRAGPSGSVLGVQIWVALPADQEEAPPRFEHYGEEAVPVLREDGVTVRLIAGSLFGTESRVRTSSPLFYAEARMEAGAVLALPPEHAERAAYVVEGSVVFAEGQLQAGEIGFFGPTGDVRPRADEASRLLLLGGAPLEGHRHISWNFVSSRKERIDRAADDWRNQRFDRVPGETAYIPLPEDGDAPVDYP
ncbi:MAG: pirin family protein [Myxococcota bacterium]